MLDLFAYLTPIGKEIASVIQQSKYIIRQNAPICRNKDLMGIVVGHNLTICLDNIKNNVSPVDHYVNETINHEAVHIAQSCKGSKLGITTNLDKYKTNDARRSRKIGGSQMVSEMEAYELEDKPEQVLAYLRKYCL